MISPETVTMIKKVSIVVVAVLGALFGVAVIIRMEVIKSMQAEAVKLGHARHIIIDDLGHTQFQWLEKNDVAPAAAPAVK